MEHRSQRLRCVMVDDEPLARDALRYLIDQCPEADLVDECENGFEAVKLVHRLQPDLLFLDIQMPKLDGFDVVELLGRDAPLIIFVTAFDEYALRAFEAAALDYLVKPVRLERLQQSLKRAADQISARQQQPLPDLVAGYRQEQGAAQRILVRDGESVTVIPVGEIVYLEAQDDYVKIVTTGGSHLKLDKISRLEELLDERQFCRIHRSYLLNTAFLRRIERISRNSYRVLLENGIRLPVSNSGHKRLLQRF